MSPEKGMSFSSSNHQFSGDMFVFRGVNHEQDHHGLHEKQRAGLLAFLETSQNPVSQMFFFTAKKRVFLKNMRENRPLKTQVILYLSEIEDMWNSEIPSEVSNLSVADSLGRSHEPSVVSYQNHRIFDVIWVDTPM